MRFRTSDFERMDCIMKKLLCMLLAAVMLLSMTCAATAEAVTKTAAVKGYGGEVSVTVTVEEGKITAVTAVGEKETVGLGSVAIEQLPAKIMEAQSVAVDAVAGATLSSNAVLEAAKAALLDAGLTEEAITVKAEKEVSAEAIELSTDVVVIGAGGAGMSAALEAKNAGAEVIVLEKMPSIGGNTLVAGSAMNASQPTLQATQTMPADRIATVEGLLALEPKNEDMARWQLQVKDEIEAYKATGSTYLFDSPAFHKLQTYVGGDYVAKTELIEILCDQATNGVYWLKQLGNVWKPEIVSVYGSTWTRGHNPTMDWGTAGAGFVLPQEKAFKEKGGDLRIGYRAEHIIMENGRAVGVTGTTTDGAPFTVKANKGVILATGGFSANEELREKYNEQWPTLMGLKTTNPPCSTGDGIIMAEEIGVNLVGMGWIQLIPYSTNSLSATIDGALFLDKDGRRFVAEDERRDVVAEKTIAHNEGWFYSFYDRKTIIDELNGITIYGKDIVKLAEEDDTVYYAETMEELAAQMGMDYAVLKETVDTYNAAVDAGVDAIGRQNLPMKINEGPFCVTTSEIMVHHTMGGVEINTDCEVLDTDGNVIPGLFAAGEVTGGIHGSNRLGGNAITDVVVFGRIAGKNAAAN